MISAQKIVIYAKYSKIIYNIYFFNLLITMY